MARRAGVSQKTVSRVMNGEAMVSDEMRERVLAAARELGYRPNSAARALVAGRTHRLGFVSLGTTLHGPVATLVAAEQAARAHGYSMAIVTTASSEPSAVREAIEALVQQGVEGVVVSEPVDMGSVEVALDVPVLIYGHAPGLSAPHVVSTMNAGDRGAERATQHLLDLGHQTVHHVAGPPTWYASRERREGWERALRAAGTAVPAPIEGDWTAQSGHLAGLVLGARVEVTAVFCANDDMALGVLRALHDLGRDVPGEVSVLGFDDVPTAAFSTPALSTIRNPFDTGSAAGIAALVAAIEDPTGPTPASVEPSGQLVLRESTGPAPTRLWRRGGDRRD